MQNKACIFINLCYTDYNNGGFMNIQDVINKLDRYSESKRTKNAKRQQRDAYNTALDVLKKEIKAFKAEKENDNIK